MPPEHSPAPGVAPVRIAICIATCRRPARLARLLDGLAHLRISGERAAVRVVVVDNDAQGSSREVCAIGQEHAPFPLEYRIEPRPGIPFARNACVAACRDEVDAIAFVDDDEVPHADWLEHLLDTRERFSADIVTGPALPTFEEPPPRWAVEGGFFDLPRYETGSERDRAFTNNVLVNCAVFDSLKGWFDERLQFTGGSDTYFFRRAHLAGFRIVWCNEALLYDYVPADRVSRSWVLQRAYRYGHTHAFVRHDLGQDTRGGLIAAAVGRMRFAAGSAVRGIVRRQESLLLESLAETAYTIGMLANIAGVEYNEYGRKSARGSR